MYARNLRDIPTIGAVLALKKSEEVRLFVGGLPRPL